MRVSVILVTNKTRGLTIPVNGLLGQVEFKCFDKRQVYDTKARGIVVREDVPVMKRFGPFELVVIDVSKGGPEREQEVVGAKKLASGDDTARKGWLNTYDLVYEPMPGSSVWEAIVRGVERARGDIVVFMPDLAYPAPNFLEAHVKAHAEAKAVAASPTSLRTYCIVRGSGARDYVTLGEGTTDPLGALLDPYCDVTGGPMESAANLNLDTPFFRLVSASFERVWLGNPRVLVPPARGFELTYLARQAAIVYGAAPRMLAGPEACLARLDPKSLGEPDPDADPTAYQKMIQGSPMPKPDIVAALAPVKPWYRRMFG